MNRRGLSTVVGMVFAIIALTTTVTYIAYSMNILSQFDQTIVGQSQQTLNQAKEKFQVTGAAIVNNNFNITVANTGVLPINFTKVWVTDTTDQNYGTDWTYSYTPIHNFVAPSAVLTNIGQDFPHPIITTDAFNIKLVTSRGNEQQFNINTGASAPVFMQINASPTASPGSTIQVLYTVMNNQSNNNILLNLQPRMAVSVTGTGSYSLVSGPSPSSFPSLIPGQSVTFKWLYTVGQNTGDTVTFTASLASGPTNTASTIVTLAYPQFASQSQTSLQTQGLVCCKTNDNTMVLHQETFDTLNGAYQLYSGQVDNKTGHTINFVDNGIIQQAIFDTNYDNSTAVSIPQGNWVLSMYYKSVPIPSTLGIPSPDMIFLFNQSEQLLDSSTYNNQMVEGGGSAAPTFQSSCSRDSSGCFSFTGSSDQYLSVTPNPATTGGGNEIGSNDVTVTGWFNPTTLPSSQAVIYSAYSSSSNYFTVYLLSSGQLQLTFETPYNTISCISSGSGSTVKAGDWEFFVAARTGTDNCSLYINGTNVASTSNSNGNTNKEVITVNSIYIGGDPDHSSYGFNGMIDYIMYWNNYAINTSTDASGLDTKSYGPSAHVVNIRADIVNAKTGTWLANVFTANNVVLPYVDGAASSTGWEYKNFTETNVFNTTGTNGAVFVGTADRLVLNVTYANEPSYAQDMKWDIDDITIPNNIFTSYLTIPPPSQPFDSYYTYSLSQPLTLSVTNQGPNGIWLVSATTRIIFQTVTPGIYSAAAVAISDNGTGGCSSASDNIMGTLGSGHGYTQDSYFIPVYGNTLLTFTTPSEVPYSCGSAQTGLNIQPGYHYKMYINLSGYDDQGNSVFRTIYIGLVKVTS